MLLEIIKRILVGIIATVLFSISLTFFSFQPSEASTSFFGLFLLFAIFSGPVFIIAGVICSIIIDILCSKYLHALVWYVFAGIVSAIAFLLVVLGNSFEMTKETLSLLGWGIIASLLYYHILIIWKTRFFKRSFHTD